MCPSHCLFLSVHVWGSVFVLGLCVCWVHHLTLTQLSSPDHTTLHIENHRTHLLPAIVFRAARLTPNVAGVGSFASIFCSETSSG